jgi:beta-glucosidase/6-phospho-beta-glucosidase/beta-galactosidase
MTTSTAPAKPEELITTDASLAAILPSNFIFAASTAAYQIEGAWDVDGKGPSVWDDFQDYGKDACRSYVHWREDIKLLKAYGVNAYRFSISWPRVKPLGRSPHSPSADS